LRSAFAQWFTDKTPEQLALQVVKYQQRDGWSARDMLRLAHPHAANEVQEAVFRWVVGGLEATGTRSVKRRAGNKTVDYPDVRKHLPAIIEAFAEDAADGDYQEPGQDDGYRPRQAAVTGG
jgi:60 kDa SS-A/Ro ribonucleoprotein